MNIFDRLFPAQHLPVGDEDQERLSKLIEHLRFF